MVGLRAFPGILKRSLASLGAALLLVLALGVTTVSASHSSIQTIAGGGDLLGDGGPAADATLDPTDSVRDTVGNIYIADTFGHRIRKVGPDGIITTVAGTGSAGFSGDGGQATLARLNNPYGVEVDPAGNLYIADSLNNRVRKVSSDGVITTMAGGSQNLADGVPATQARLSTPYRITFRSGELFISDTGHHKIRKVDAQGVIRTFAGTVNGFGGDGGPATAARLHLPWKVAFDASGNAFIADAANHRIRKVDPQGVISTFAGSGVSGLSAEGTTAIQAQFFNPVHVAIDGQGALLVADLDNLRVRRILSDVVTTFAGGGVANEANISTNGIPATSAHLKRVWGVSSWGGEAFISSDVRLRRVDATGTIWTVAGGGAPCFGGDGGPATTARLCRPTGAAVDQQGSLYIADSLNLRIRKTSSGKISTIAGNGQAGDSGDGGPAVQASFKRPVAVVPDALGGYYVLDSEASRVRRVSPSGIISTVAGTGLKGFSGDGGPGNQASLQDPESLALGPNGDLYVADTGNHRIRKVNLSDGLITTVAGDGTARSHGDGGPAKDAGLFAPKGIALDKEGSIYIADSGNGRIRKVTPAGKIYTLHGGSEAETISSDSFVQNALRAVIYPTSIAVDPDGIRIIFVDEFRQGDTRCPSQDPATCYPDWAVRQIDGYGRVTNLAGGNGRGFSGDGGNASKAQFNDLRSVFMSVRQELIVADSANNRIRMFGMDPIPQEEREASRARNEVHRTEEEVVDPMAEQVISTLNKARSDVEEVMAQTVEDGLTALADAGAAISSGLDQVLYPTKRVSTSQAEEQSNGKSDQARLSGSGQHVAFVSSGSNLVPNDINATTDIFVKDRRTGGTTMVSVSTQGTQANGPSFQPAISYDGRFVAFTSSASNLAVNDSNLRDDVFLRDRDTDVDGIFDEADAVSTSNVSMAPGGLPANGQGGHPSLSSNGRYLAFASLASNLVPGDLNRMADVFLLDLKLRVTTRVSTAVAEANGHSVWPSVSDDGTVAFESQATNLVAGDTNGVLDVFVGGAAGTSSRVSLRSDLGEPTLASSGAHISGDGLSVAFHTASAGMVGEDKNGVLDVFVHNLASGRLRLVSEGIGGGPANGASATPALSWDGRYVAFGSSASNLIANDFNLVIDVFVRDMSTGITRRSSIGSSESNGTSVYPWISGNGQIVAFQSDASNLVDRDDNSVTDIFVRTGPV